MSCSRRSCASERVRRSSLNLLTNELGLAYGIFVGVLEEGLVATIRHALHAQAIRAPAGIIGEVCLSQQ